MRFRVFDVHITCDESTKYFQQESDFICAIDILAIFIEDNFSI